MHELSDQLGTVRKLIEQAPDSMLGRLSEALAGAGQLPLREISDLVSAEGLERSVRAAAFSPVSPLCAPSAGPIGLSLPADTLPMLWSALKARSPNAIADVVRRSTAPGADTARLFDSVCRQAAKGLREGGTPEFTQLATRLDRTVAEGAKVLGQLLELSPLARRALPHLPRWARALNHEHDGAIRAAFQEAAGVADNAALLMELLFAHLDDPYHILRLVAAVMDHPSEHYLAASEMATFGRRLMDDMDRRLEVMRRFDPNRGLEAGAEIAAAANVVSHGLTEFGARMSLSTQGPWGARLQGQRRVLGLNGEARLREIQPAVDAVLPAINSRAKSGKPFGLPSTAEPPNPYLVTRAQALLAFLYGVKTGACGGSFDVLRSKLTEDLTCRLDFHVENLLTELHRAPGPGREPLRAHIEVAADLLGLVQNPASAEFVRRRAAAA